MKQEQVYRSAGHTAVGEVEDCAEEGARIVHPWELIVKEREVEHVHDLTEHERERSSRHHCLGPYETVEEAVDDVTHRTGSNHGQSHKNTCRRFRLLCQLVYPPAERSEKDDAEDRKQNLAPVSSEGHAESHALVEHEMELEPVPYYVDSLSQVHIRLDQNLDDLVKYD